MNATDELAGLLGRPIRRVVRVRPNHDHRLGPDRDAQGLVKPVSFAVVFADDVRPHVWSTDVREIRRGAVARRLGVGPRALLAALHAAAESPTTGGDLDDPDAA